MRRRDVISVTASAIVTALASARMATAQPARPRTIGVLVFANPEPFWSLFRAAMRDLGYNEGPDLRYEFRAAEGDSARLNEQARDLVRLKVDLIVASLTPAVLAAKQATSEIPIVMAGAGDPVATGLVASLAAPGGNVTGLSAIAAELGGKLLEVIRDMLPAARRLAVVAHGADSFTRPFLEQLEVGRRRLDMTTQVFEVRGADEFEAVFDRIASDRVDALVIQPSLPRKPAIDLALKHRLPSFSPVRSFPAEGGLASYSGNQLHILSRAASYVDRILKGAKPAELPVEQPTKFDLVVNLRTARVLGLTVPPMLLARADEVIE
jgi:putative ABC transport system substrate-binding protein